MLDDRTGMGGMGNRSALLPQTSSGAFLWLAGVSRKSTTLGETSLFPKSGRFPWVSGGFLERMIPGKNGAVSPRKSTTPPCPFLNPLPTKIPDCTMDRWNVHCRIRID